MFKFKIYALNSDLLAFELQKEKKLFEACFHIVIPLSKHIHCLPWSQKWAKFTDDWFHCLSVAVSTEGYGQ